MAQDDYAIVVGLQNYPGLDDPENGQPSLTGPENDANAFYDWLLKNDGGDVPDKHIDLILSSNFQPPATSIMDAKPVVSDVEYAFRKLRIRSENNAKNGQGLRVGHRLYIFMAGHGIAPDQYGANKAEWEAALLMANVERSNLSATYHILGGYTASWFCRNDCFDEVFLFMDCCRESALVQGLNYFLPPKGNSTNAIRCFIYGTRWSRLARERPMEDENQTVRGVFTKTLLLGLSGAAAEPLTGGGNNDGVITVASLKSYLFQNMKSFQDPDLEEDLQEPGVDYYPDTKEGRDIVIKPVPLQKFPVAFHVPEQATGNVSILYNGKDVFGTLPVANPPETLATDLPRGKYLAIVSINGNAKIEEFDVTGIEGLATKGGKDVYL